MYPDYLEEAIKELKKWKDALPVAQRLPDKIIHHRLSEHAKQCDKCKGKMVGLSRFEKLMADPGTPVTERPFVEALLHATEACYISPNGKRALTPDDIPPAFAENHIGIYVCIISGDLNNTVGERILVEIQQAIGSSRVLQDLRTELGKSFIARAINRQLSAATPDQRLREAAKLIKLGHAKAVIWGHWVEEVGQIYCTTETTKETPTTETLSEWGFGQISRWYDSRPRARWLEHTWAFEQKLAGLALGSTDMVYPRHEQATKAELRWHLGNLIGDRLIIVKPPLPYWLLTHRSSRRLLILIHGWHQDYLQDWMPIVKTLLQSGFADFDICSLGYTTGLASVGSAQSVAGKLAVCVDELRCEYQSVDILSFSRGGLILLNYLLNVIDDGRSLDFLEHAVLVGCPTTRVVDASLRPFLDEPEYLSLYNPDKTTSLLDAVKSRIEISKRSRPVEFAALLDKLWLFSGTEDKALDWDGAHKVYNQSLLLPKRANLVELPYEHYPLILMTSPDHLSYQALLKVMGS